MITSNSYWMTLFIGRIPVRSIGKKELILLAVIRLIFYQSARGFAVPRAKHGFKQVVQYCKSKICGIASLIFLIRPWYKSFGSMRGCGDLVIRQTCVPRLRVMQDAAMFRFFRSFISHLSAECKNNPHFLIQ